MIAVLLAAWRAAAQDAPHFEERKLAAISEDTRVDHLEFSPNGSAACLTREGGRTREYPMSGSVP